MIASPHLAAGFVAGLAGARLPRRKWPRVIAAFTIGLLTHVALDAIPHSDYRLASAEVMLTIVGLEIIAVCTIAGMMIRPRLTPGWPWPLAAGLVGATILDAKFVAKLLLPLQLAVPVTYHGDQIHRHFHAGLMSRPALGLVFEITATILLLALLTRFPRTRSVSQ